MVGRDTTKRIELRSVEDEQVAVIRAHQNGECKGHVSGMLDFDPRWAPMSDEQVKAKLDERRKKDRTALFGIWSKDEFLGLGLFSADWDTLCPHIHVLIWPEHRRKGYGTEAATHLLESCFNHYWAHVVGCGVPDFDEGGIAFAEKLGFKRQGVERRAGIVDGKFFDDVFLDILRDEFLSARSEGGDA
jgi:RimJ/RimL family protein N-acetyltransferase